MLVEINCGNIPVVKSNTKLLHVKINLKKVFAKLYPTILNIL